MSHPPSSASAVPLARGRRRGVALIVAIVILAALLLLGLPFIFSQSSSLSGTRAFAHSQHAHLGLGTAENLGVGLAAEAFGRHLQPARFLSRTGGSAALATAFGLYSTLDLGLGDLLALDAPGAVVFDTGLGENRVLIDLDRLGLPVRGDGPMKGDYSGVTITAESGKLDVNTLDSDGWHRLLRNVGINDWDDGWPKLPSVLSDPNNPNSPRIEVDFLTNDNDGGYNTPTEDDADQYGELAEALARVRFLLPGQRITSLDQLLQADPQRLSPKFRWKLTRSELALLRPHLTAHTLGQGRQGLIDVGTVTVKISPANGNAFFTDVPAHVIARLLGAGTWVMTSTDLTTLKTGVIMRDLHDGNRSTTRHRISGNNLSWQIQTGFDRQTLTPAADEAIAIQAPAAVNINQATSPVRAAFHDVQDPLKTLPGKLAANQDDLATLNAGANASGFTLQAPIVPGLANDLDPAGNVKRDHEMPPLSKTSGPWVTIEAGSASQDAANRLAAQGGRTVIAQTVNQESAIEAPYVTQGALHALTASRHGSQLDTFPNPHERRAGIRPDDVAVTNGDLDRTTGLRPHTLPDLTSAQGDQSNEAFRNVDWKLTFSTGGSGDPVLNEKIKTGDPASTPARSPTTPDDLITPEGLRLEGGATLSYRLTTTHGIIKPQAANDQELSARHLAMWIKPRTAWSGETVIFEVRSPQANAGDQIDGTAGSNDFQNLWRLHYDATNELLVLTLANSAIEHTSDFQVGGTAYNAPVDLRVTPEINESSLGGGSSPLAPRVPSEGAKVRHFYKVKGGFQPGRWHLLQVSIANDRPGGHAIVLDGVVGRDASANAVASLAAMRHGDHATLPCVRLVAEIPAVNVAQVGGTALDLPTIEVQPVLGFNADQLFPARGMLRIDDEYITYTTVTGNTFNGCKRGERQNTVQGGGNVPQNWPGTQIHPINSLVYPGGYRINVGDGQFFRGSGTLAAALGAGDTTPDPYIGQKDPVKTASDPKVVENRFRTWGFWKKNSLPSEVNGDTPPKRVVRCAPTPNFTKIDLDGEFPTGAFPPRGFVLVRSPEGGQFVLYYKSNSGGSLGNFDCFGNASPAFGAPNAITEVDSFAFNADNAPGNASVQVILLSIEVTGADFAQFPPIQPLGAFQVEHPGTRRIEWLTYTHTRIASDGSAHFVHRTGFPFGNVNSGTGAFTRSPTGSGRGAQRSAYAGDPLFPLLGADAVFPAGSVVLPVHGIVGFARAHFIATGDVVTLAKPTTETGIKPVQLVVRFAATDGYPDLAAAASGQFDTRNEWFSFAAPVPTSTLTNGSTFEMLGWPCWSGDDISSLNPTPTTRGLMPRMDAFNTGYTPDSDAEMVIGSADSRRGGSGATMDAVLDTMLAAATPRAGRASDLCQVTRLLNSAGNALLNTGSQATFIVDANQGIFNDQRCGIMLLDGEAVAYRPLTGGERGIFGNGYNGSRHVCVIGRGLLGSSIIDHQLPTTAPQIGLAVMTLPIGPVYQLNTALPAGVSDLVTFTENPNSPGGFQEQPNAPALLITSPDGLKHEILLNPNKATAPWLRGLYNSTVENWTLSDPGPIAIGWWPRYPSALPKDLPSNARHQAALLRCRAYAWAGFPLRLYGARFDLSVGQPRATVSLLDDGGGLFRVEARALATGLDWMQATAVGVTAGADRDVSGAFNGTQFANKAVDGAELRVTWQYAAATPGATNTAQHLADLATNGNRAPTLGAVRVRCLAPSTILATQSAK